MSFMVTSYLLINGDGGYRLQNAHGSVVNVISQLAVSSKNHFPKNQLNVPYQLMGIKRWKLNMDNYTMKIN